MATKQKKAPAAKKTPARPKSAPPKTPRAASPAARNKRETARVIEADTLVESHRADTLQKDAARAAGKPELADAPGEGQAAYPDGPHGHAPCLEF